MLVWRGQPCLVEPERAKAGRGMRGCGQPWAVPAGAVPAQWEGASWLDQLDWAGLPGTSDEGLSSKASQAGLAQSWDPKV